MTGFCQLLSSVSDPQSYYNAETNSSVEKRVFKYTSCGAWIKITEEYIQVGTIVEGSDAEFTADPLYFPFTVDEFFERLQECEDFAEGVWAEMEKDDDDEWD